MPGDREIDGRVEPVAGVVCRGRQPRRLAQHQRRLVGETEDAGVGQDIDRRRAIDGIGRVRHPRTPPLSIATARSATVEDNDAGRASGEHRQHRDRGPERAGRDAGRLRARRAAAGRGRPRTPAPIPGRSSRRRPGSVPRCRRAAATTSAVRPDAETATNTRSAAGAVGDAGRGVLDPRGLARRAELRRRDQRRVARAAHARRRRTGGSAGNADSTAASGETGRLVGREAGAASAAGPPRMSSRNRSDAIGHASSSNSARIPSVGAYSQVGRYVVA